MSDYCMCHIESYWQELMDLSTEEFMQEAYMEALSHSREAFYRAEVLATYADRCEKLKIPFVEIYTFSCENLACMYQHMGESLQAVKILNQGISFLGYLYKQKLLSKEVFEEQIEALNCLFR